MNSRFVSWRRVSTFKQGRSGLGLEAQKEIIRYFVERDKGELIADYEECYTGKELSGCKELRKAMNHAKREHATLIIAKSDRFRNTAEALQIYEEMGDGNIMFCDLPMSDKFSLTLFFALAEREALLVSIRTKQALAVKKSQGALLGSANPIYRENYNNKSMEERLKSSRKRGQTKTERYLASRDVQAFIKVLRKCFPDATQGELTEWNWKGINTKDGVRQQVLGLMRDFKELDSTIFVRWQLENLDEVKLQCKLANLITSIKRSALKLQLFNNNNNSNN